MIPAATVAVRTIQRRPFSLVSSLRAVGRVMELHPFERLPTTQKSAPADWGRQVRRVTSQAAFFFPGMALMLGWPFLAKRLLDGGADYEIPESMRLGYGWE